MTVYERMIAWLDSAEGRTLTLVSANADFGAPAHVIEFSTMDRPPAYVYGETREEIMDRIEATTRGDK
jgi:hypothetical protein